MKKFLIFFGTLVLVALVLLVMPQSAKDQLWHATEMEAFLQNFEGVTSLKGKDVSGAVAAWGKGTAENPERKELALNLGFGLQLLGRGPDANKAYDMALKAPTIGPGEQFVVAFNRGAMYGQEKEIDQALVHYQKALDLDPNSKEAKINIELLLAGGGGGGQGDKKDKSDKGEGKDDQDQQDQDKDGDKDDQKKEYAKNPKPQKPKFDSQDLSQNDVNKILSEIKQQEQKIRADFNRKEAKESRRGKDW